MTGHAKAWATAAVALALVAAGGGLASAADWFDAGRGSRATVRTATVPGFSAGPAARRHGDAVVVRWVRQRIAPGVGVRRYAVQRLDGAGHRRTVCTTTAGTCADADVPAGVWRYRVRAVHGRWRGPWSAPGTAVTVPGRPPVGATAPGDLRPGDIGGPADGTGGGPRRAAAGEPAGPPGSPGRSGPAAAPRAGPGTPAVPRPAGTGDGPTTEPTTTTEPADTTEPATTTEPAPRSATTPRPDAPRAAATGPPVPDAAGGTGARTPPDRH